MSIREYNGIFCGFEPDFRADGVLAEFSAILGDPLLGRTMFDSRPMKSPLAHEAGGPIAGAVSVWFAGMILPAWLIPNLVGDTPLLTGFDEIYFLANDRGSMPDSAAYFTSERAAFSGRPPEEFFQLWRMSGAVGYLSDGCGLNFACRDNSAASRFEAALRTARFRLGKCTGPPDCERAGIQNNG